MAVQTTQCTGEIKKNKRVDTFVLINKLSLLTADLLRHISLSPTNFNSRLCYHYIHTSFPTPIDDPSLSFNYFLHFIWIHHSLVRELTTLAREKDKMNFDSRKTPHPPSPPASQCLSLFFLRAHPCTCLFYPLPLMCKPLTGLTRTHKLDEKRERGISYHFRISPCHSHDSSLETYLSPHKDKMDVKTRSYIPTFSLTEISIKNIHTSMIRGSCRTHENV